jgi:hypothetical protein
MYGRFRFVPSFFMIRHTTLGADGGGRKDEKSHGDSGEPARAIQF